MTRPRLGLTVTHRRYVPYSHAHYAGNLVDGAYSLGPSATSPPRCASAPTATRACSPPTPTVQFLAPVRAGDVIEVDARLVRVGTRSREIEFEVRVVGRGAPERGASAADVLDPPIVATTARGVVVVPPSRVTYRCAGAHPAPVCRAPGCRRRRWSAASGWRSRTPTSGGSHPSGWRCSPGRR